MDWHSRFLQQAQWTRDLRLYLFQQAGIDLAKKVLEVGCGTGAIIEDLETSASIFGLDIDLDRLFQARTNIQKTSLINGNALSLPWATGTFDITFCHFLLLWIKQPLLALQEMKRVTRPGGSILAFAEPDYENRIDRPSSLIPLGKLQTESLRRQGAEPGLGRHLSGLFQLAGITICETGILDRNDAPYRDTKDRELEWEVIRSDLSPSISTQRLNKYQHIDEEAWLEGSRQLSIPIYFASGLV